MATARPYDVVTFDCYGTLVDWEGGLATAIMRAAWADGVPARAGGDHPGLHGRGAGSRGGRLPAVPRGPGGFGSRRRGPPRLAARSRAGVVPAPTACRAGCRFPTPTRPSSASARPATRWASCRTSTTTSWRRPGGTSPWTSSSSSPPSRCGRTSPRARTSRPPAGRSARAPGSTSARATSTTWCRRGPTGIPNAWINRNGDTPEDGGRADREFPTLSRAGRLAGPGPVTGWEGRRDGPLSRAAAGRDRSPHALVAVVLRPPARARPRASLRSAR